jgi:hypothetical protein
VTIGVVEVTVLGGQSEANGAIEVTVAAVRVHVPIKIVPSAPSPSGFARNVSIGTPCWIRLPRSTDRSSNR